MQCKKHHPIGTSCPQLLDVTRAWNGTIVIGSFWDKTWRVGYQLHQNHWPLEIVWCMSWGEIRSFYKITTSMTCHIHSYYIFTSYIHVVFNQSLVVSTRAIGGDPILGRYLPSNLPHTIHGTNGIFTDPWMVDFSRVGQKRETTPSKLSNLGHICNFNDLFAIQGCIRPCQKVAVTRRITFHFQVLGTAFLLTVCWTVTSHCHNPEDPCTVYLATFTIKMNQM